MTEKILEVKIEDEIGLKAYSMVYIGWINCDSSRIIEGSSQVAKFLDNLQKKGTIDAWRVVTIPDED